MGRSLLRIPLTFSAMTGRVSGSTGPLSDPSNSFAFYHSTPVSRHFYAEVSFEPDNAIGLALIQEKNGNPDLDNYTSIIIELTSAGEKYVRVEDRQNGQDHVLDNTNSLSPDRYNHHLNFNFSVPFNTTNQKIRIFRDDLSGFFHYYYAVRQKIRGQWVEGWMELAPSRDWGHSDQQFYVALLVHPDQSLPVQIFFDDFFVIQKPVQDIDDRETGFQATWRDFNWSGQFGNALVISFDESFAFHGQDIKFVFWEATQFIPVWHLNNQLLYSYEFVETWGGGIIGCHEPMSDRLLRWSSVDLVEDNEVRKVVHWHYVLCNPDYQIPGGTAGLDFPEVDEWYTIYPDGTILRKIQYFPKLDSDFNSWHELTELIVIAGSGSNPSEHLNTPALSVSNLDGLNVDFYPNRQFISLTNSWDQIITTAHFTDAPDAYSVFSHDPEVPETYAHYPIVFDLSWHNTTYQMCHWPVGLEPYQEPCKTHGTWKSQVSHTSLIGAGVYEGQNWSQYTKTDSRGRKYREWISLIGLNQPGESETVLNRIRDWLHPGQIILLDSTCIYEGFAHDMMEYRLKMTPGESSCKFDLLIPDSDDGKDRVLKNPVFLIEDWGNRPAHISIDGSTLTMDKQFKTSKSDSAMLIWINQTFESPVSISVSDTLISNDQTGFIMLQQNYPNPFFENTTLSYILHEPAFVTLKIYNISGQCVSTLLEGMKNPGTHTLKWAPFNETSSGLAGGLYICHIQANDYTDSRKILMVE